MILVSAEVGPFRSIETPQKVELDSEVTVLVGMNEAGKTVFLKALQKSNDATGDESFSTTDDYPRKSYTSYMRRHDESPDVAVKLTYQLTKIESDLVNTTLKTTLAPDYQFSVSHNYANKTTVSMCVDEAQAIAEVAASTGLSTDAAVAIKKAKSLRQTIGLLTNVERTEADDALLATLKERIAKTTWDRVLDYEVWSHVVKNIPKFLYFSDYDLLPGKLNLNDLNTRVATTKSDPNNTNKHLQPKHKAVLALLRMADVNIDDFSGNTGYEELKAKVEAVSISLTDQVMEFWKQNEDLEVEVDVRTDSTDEPPFNSGPNLYLRIKNRRHRGVSTSFDQRSRGFIWFFSFLVWFDSVQNQLDSSGKATQNKLVLLLDEPGLALHALAQADFLRYIDSLSNQHQVVFTTHSPFMVHSDRLHQVRIVEDKNGTGTVISDNLSSSDARTIFPLQAALGWTIAQNLFVSKRNLLVEGPSELIYLQIMSALLEAQGKKGLREDITIVPTGGLSNVVTFVSLLGASGLELAVLHDFKGSPEQKLEDLVKQKLLNQKALFNVSQFRDLTKIGENSVASDVEDLLSVKLYLDYFNKTFTKSLGKKVIKETDLPNGTRIIDRLERALVSMKIDLRPIRGFNHYAVAVAFGSSPPVAVDDETINKFEALFEAINKVFK